jgi:hypothetical protein
MPAAQAAITQALRVKLGHVAGFLNLELNGKITRHEANACSVGHRMRVSKVVAYYQGPAINRAGLGPQPTWQYPHVKQLKVY